MIRSILALALLASLSAEARASSEWQYTVPVPGGKAESRAYLWIPPNAWEVRGVVLAGMTLIEMPLVHDPIVRAAAARAGLAIVFFHPHFDGTFDYQQSGGDQRLLSAVNQLAQVSGYHEIARVPWITVGHSTAGIFARNVAYWNPGRTAAVVHIKSGRLGQHLPFPGARLRGVPFLAINGQYEEFGSGEGGAIPPGDTLESQWRTMRSRLLAWRAEDPEHLVSLLVEPAAGHFGWSEPLARHVALFLRKVGERRLGRPGEPMRPVRAQDGWLTDGRIESAAPAVACQARRCPDGAAGLWHLDRELAEATDAFHRGRLGGGRAQRVTFVEDGATLAPAARMRLRFQPLGDGLTFRAAGQFWDPEGQGHATGPIRFRALRGAVEQTGADLFRVRPGPFGLTEHTRRVVILAQHPGDASYRAAEQPADLIVPLGSEQGAAQTLTFAAPADLTALGSAQTLRARSSTGLPVGFYVESGPAVVEGNLLRPTTLPPRARFPAPVTVVAYQLGRIEGPAVRAAVPVRRTLHVRAPARAAFLAPAAR